MAIDYNAGINSIDVGAHDITYSGNEGPKSPEQKQMMAFDDTPRFELKPLRELISEYEADHNGESPRSIDALRRYFYSKYGPEGIAQVEQAVQREEQQAQMQQRGGIQMASAADDILEKEYQQYVFEMEEQGLEPMSLEEFRQQAVAGMATGRRAGYKNGSSVQAGAVNYEPSEMVSVPTEFRAREHSPNTHLAYITNDEAGILQALKPDTPHIGPQGIPNYDSFDAQGVYTSSTGERSGGYDSKSQKSKEAQKKAKSAKPSKFIQEKIDKGEPTSIQTKEQEKQAAKDAKAFLKSKEPEKKTILQKANALVGPQAWYAWAQGIPGAKTNLLRQRKRYKDYLEKYYGPDYNLDWFDEEDIEDYDLYKRLVGMERPIAESGMSPGMTYAEFLASGGGSKYGAPNFTLLSKGDLGNLSSLKKPDNIIDPKTGLLMTDARWEQLKRDSGHGDYGGGEPTPEWQRQGYPSYEAWLAAQQAGGLPATTAAATTTPATTPATTTQTASADPFQVASFSQADLDRIYGTSIPTTGTLGWTRPSPNILQHQFVADGGRIGYAGGGIADLRQGYFLGKLVKSITKPVKKAFKSVSKVAKSPVGLAALSMFAPQLMGKFIPGMENTGWTGNFLSKLGTSIKKNPFNWIAGASALGGLYTGMTQDDDEEEQYKKWLAEKQAADAYWIPRFEGAFADGGRIGYADGKTFAQKAKEWLMRKGYDWLDDMPDEEILKVYELQRKDGGRIGYAEGGNNDEEDHRSAALTQLYKPKMMAQEGGLMDLGGMEKDYRNEGGFVPIGGQERADDVPARLSKNEFVFTADAVRNAGGGDIDKGAEVMENLMENLEKGGKVSEESQGLEGARDMFATAQRLEGVL